MGRVGAGPVCGAFYNFDPAMVRQAVPACWDVADPGNLTVIRAQGAGRALEELCSTEARQDLVGALSTLGAVAEGCDSAGRILTGANQAVLTGFGERLHTAGRHGDTAGVAVAWQACTLLREHRGDGHVAALVAHDLSGLEAHLLAAGVHGVPVEVLRDNRGWSEEAWTSGHRRLMQRGLLTEAGAATDQGREHYGDVEAQTDALAEVPWTHLSDREVNDLAAVLGACARAVQSSGLLPFPNPMGLPPIV